MHSPSLKQSSTESTLLPPVGREFYSRSVKALLPMLGTHEHPTYDFHSAVYELNRGVKLGRCGIERRALSFMFTGLYQSQRFSGDMHIESHKGENSAVHSIHCALLMTDQLDASGLLELGMSNDEISLLRIRMTLGCLVHDMGEMLGEFGSVAQSTISGSTKDFPVLERRIFALTLRLAFHAAEQNEPTLFYKALQKLRVSANIRPGVAFSTERLHGLLDDFERTVISPLQLSPELENRYSSLLDIYDAVEMKQDRFPHAKFISRGVKAVEHMQGQRHYIRLSTKEEGQKLLREFSTPTSPTSEESMLLEQATDQLNTLPLSLQSSPLILGSIGYTEGGLGELWAEADTDFKKALAERIIVSVYQTVIEFLSGAAYVVDRETQGVSPEITKLFDEISSGELSRGEVKQRLEIAQALLLAERELNLGRCRLEREGVARELHADTVFRYETRCRLMSRYMAAIERRRMPSPGEAPLALLKEVPHELRGYGLIAWHRRNGLKES